MAKNPWRKIKLMSIVKVEWVDASFESGWVHYDDLPVSTATVFSVGFLVRVTKDLVVIALDHDPHKEMLNGVAVMPRDNVVAIEVLRDPMLASPAKGT